MHALIWSLLLLPRYILAVVVNVTVDDADSAVLYYPSEAWNIRTAETPCLGCTAQPDSSKMLDGTWHDGTFNPVPGSNSFPNIPLTATVTFEGSAVYVFCALAETTSSPDGNSDMSFYIDGEFANSFVRSPPGSYAYDYRVPVFSISSLSSGVHTLVIQNGHVNATKSLVLLDFIVYSVDDGSSPSFISTPSPPLSLTTTFSTFSSESSLGSSTSSSISNSSNITSSSNHLARIIGPAVAVPVGLVLLLVPAAFLLYRRWRRQGQRRLQVTNRERTTVASVPPPALSNWDIEPLALPPSHPASGYVDGSGRPIGQSVQSAPTSSSVHEAGSSHSNPEPESTSIFPPTAEHVNTVKLEPLRARGSP